MVRQHAAESRTRGQPDQREDDMPARDRRRPFWSKWVWKDWDAKTRDLSPYEYTAYHRLLSYAATCSTDLCSVPDDDRRLARAVGFGVKRWLAVRPRVLDYFFLRGDRRYEHKRLREDATSWLELSENNRSRVNAALPRVATGRTRPVQPEVLHARGGQKLEVRIEEESVNTLSPSSPNGSVWRARFPDFWELWPRKTAKKAAATAWKRLDPKDGGAALFAKIAAAIAEAKQSEQWKRGIIPHPATYLNGERWTDQLNGSEPDPMARMKRLLAEKEAEHGSEVPR